MKLTRLMVSASIVILVGLLGLIFIETRPLTSPNNTVTSRAISQTQSGANTTSNSISQSSDHNNTTKGPLTGKNIVNITSIQVTKTGPIGPFLLVAVPHINSTYSAGSTISLNFSIAFANVGDEGYIQYNSSASLANVSVVTPGFQLLHVIVNFNPDENPLYLPMQNFVKAIFVFSAPSKAYSGPLLIHLDAQPTGPPVYGKNPGF